MDVVNKKQIDAFKMLESMTESVLITTTELESPGPFIIYVNPAFEKMTGWTKQEVIGQNPRILQGAKTEAEIFQDLRDKLAKGEIWSGRTINYKKDGSEFFMEWSIVPIKNAEGLIHQYLAVQKDVTKIVHTEHKLRRSRQKEQKRLIEIEQKNQELKTLIDNQKMTLDLFVKYVPESIIRKGLSEKKKNIREGERLEVALLFCDIRSFTTIAEGLDPQDIVHFLNVYYTRMSEVITNHNGVVNQFVGDEIFVSFGAPLPIQDAELSAVHCAIDMVAKLDEINKELKDTIENELAIGIGINYGPIIAGNLGSKDRLSYSITGDAVNTAKRIESLTIKIPNAILISQSIYDKVSGQIETNPWGEVQIKGKNNKVNVFQVISKN